MEIKSNFLKINTVTPSGFIYTKECLEDMCNQMKKIIENGCSYGELKHNSDVSMPRIVELKNASHFIKYIELSEEEIITDVHFIKKYPEEFINKLAITPRMTGVIIENEKGEKIIDQMKIITFDLTSKIN